MSHPSNTLLNLNVLDAKRKKVNFVSMESSTSIRDCIERLCAEDEDLKNTESAETMNLWFKHHNSFVCSENFGVIGDYKLLNNALLLLVKKGVSPRLVGTKSDRETDLDDLPELEPYSKWSKEGKDQESRTIQLEQKTPPRTWRKTKIENPFHSGTVVGYLLLRFSDRHIAIESLKNILQSPIPGVNYSVYMFFFLHAFEPLHMVPFTLSLTNTTSTCSGKFTFRPPRQIVDGEIPYFAGQVEESRALDFCPENRVIIGIGEWTLVLGLANKTEDFNVCVFQANKKNAPFGKMKLLDFLKTLMACNPELCHH